MKELIKTDNAPAAIGPYSQAAKVGNLLFVSGQLPLDPKTMEFVGDDIASQTEQSLKNLIAIVEAAGSNVEKIVKVNIFLADIKDFAAMNEVYAKFFTTNPPARAAVEVANLPKYAKVEIEAVAEC